MFEQQHCVRVCRLSMQLCILMGLMVTQLVNFGKIATPPSGEMGNGWEIDEILVFSVILKRILGNFAISYSLPSAIRIGHLRGALGSE